MLISLRRSVSEGDVVTFKYVETSDSEQRRGKIVAVNGGSSRDEAPRSLVVDCDERTNFVVSIDKMIVRRQEHTAEPSRLVTLRQK